MEEYDYSRQCELKIEELSKCIAKLIMYRIEERRGNFGTEEKAWEDNIIYCHSLHAVFTSYWFLAFGKPPDASFSKHANSIVPHLTSYI